jgi:hypothetical protein
MICSDFLNKEPPVEQDPFENLICSADRGISDPWRNLKFRYCVEENLLLYPFLALSTYLRSILIASFRVGMIPPGIVFPPRFPTKLHLRAFLISAAQH